ncbi:putative bifunctional diguanylate cyclase/phosphodiesterase [Congregibacter litoralis]|uniref:Diguanylate cyclase (GGDEF) domain protein n=1 Tax=Congregibacter litoralis KT71 TaxID=314285 RepID=A4A4U0_9GAMM|nr:EAL domain-containing protein [Congregibacter litoralis]EAQ98811.2 diguanylate cyclase (GGDEF) domain protein [Congregibacter litoralis KT71]
MLIPSLAGVLVYRDVERRSLLTEQFYTVRDLGLLLGQAAQSVDQFGNLAQRSLDFYRTGNHFTINGWRQSLAAANDDLEQLLSDDSVSNRDLLDSMQRDLRAYSQLLDQLPPMLRERGIQDFGIAGDMREAVHLLEERLDEPELLVHLLMLRRHEKDYIIRDLDRYTSAHRERAAILRLDLGACEDCSGEELQQGFQLLDAYTGAFSRVVELDREIGIRSDTGLYRQIQMLESELFQSHQELMRNVAAESAKLISRAGERLAIIVGSVTIFALLFSGFLSGFLTRPLAALSLKMNRYVESRFTEEADTSEIDNSAGEVARIAHDFSEIQRATRHHLEDLHQQRQALESLNVELEEERSNLSVAQRMAGLGYWRCNPENGEFEASSELLHLLGLPPDHEFDCSGFADTVIHPDSRDQFARDLASCQRKDDSVENVYRAASPHHDEVWIRQFIRVESDPSIKGFHLVAAVQDVSRQRLAEQEIRRLAYFDSLTGLSQRGYLFERLHEMVRTARRRQEGFAVLFIDLDKFKEINDSLGHDAGDELLVTVASRLRAAARESDFVARLGGDEFCMVLDNVSSEVDVAEVAQRLLDQLSAAVEIHGTTVTPMASVGIAIYPVDGEAAESIMNAADNAMYAAKRRGDHSYLFHEHEISAEARERLRMSRDIRRAVKEDEFVVHYQPQISLESGAIEGWEALLRWQHPERGLLSAYAFIDDIERIGLVSDIGRWVIDSVSSQLAQWQREERPHTRVSINIAPRHMSEGTVARDLREAMGRHGISASQLEIEITEAGIQSGEEIREATLAVRALGVEIAIDDFGTGYASLASLRSLTIDSLKVDRSFIQFATTNAVDRRLLSSIIDLGKSFGYRLVAEGVETQEQLELLRTMGCELVQGYLFSQAVPAAEAVEMMDDRATGSQSSGAGQQRYG